MSQTLDRLKTEAESLSSQERAELAHFLLLSLEPDEEEGVAEAWEAEVARRVEQIRSGQARGKAAEQLFAELREQYP